ncbi:MAG: hypothetical protein II288_05055, partial [Alistipes sp.]|nr:hypothetical protein [Alistipes sp.]
MKKETKRAWKVRLMKIGAYGVVVILLYLATTCEGKTHISTPAKDAHKLMNIAQTVQTEEDLRGLGILIQDMEIAYRNSYGGAKAIEFRNTTNAVFEVAEANWKQYAAISDAEERLRAEFYGAIADRDAAWNTVFESKEQAYEVYKSKLSVIVDTHLMMRELLAKSIALSEEIQEAGYPKELMDENSALEKRVKEAVQQLAELREDARRYNFAVNLQYGEPFGNGDMLAMYLERDNGAITRLNEGVGYGDEVYIAELATLANNEEALAKVVAHFELLKS